MERSVFSPPEAMMYLIGLTIVSLALLLATAYVHLRRRIAGKIAVAVYGYCAVFLGGAFIDNFGLLKTGVLMALFGGSYLLWTKRLPAPAKQACIALVVSILFILFAWLEMQAEALRPVTREEASAYAWEALNEHCAKKGLAAKRFGCVQADKGDPGWYYVYRSPQKPKYEVSILVSKRRTVETWGGPMESNHP